MREGGRTKTGAKRQEVRGEGEKRRRRDGRRRRRGEDENNREEERSGEESCFDVGGDGTPARSAGAQRPERDEGRGGGGGEVEEQTLDAS